MGIYNKFILPRVTHAICGSSPVMKQRQKVVPLAEGRVLEIGVGSGHNIPFYSADKVDHLFALDPSDEMLDIARRQMEQHDITTDYVQGGAEAIPLEDHSMDSIVITYTLCSIKELTSSFSEMRRVLKPGGHLIFCEHGKAPDKSVQQWQNRLNPIWNTFGGGCNLNRDIPLLIEKGAFRIEKMDTMYIPGFRPACFNYWGVAKPR
ncbi:MAG: class I SAM-dependent methyltransferase [Saprospiraceae bacterium]|nr:class I SAM-dependent methyltransferase [Saprospiraceae bacterium]